MTLVNSMPAGTQLELSHYPQHKLIPLVKHLRAHFCPTQEFSGCTVLRGSAAEAACAEEGVVVLWRKNQSKNKGRKLIVAHVHSLAGSILGNNTWSMILFWGEKYKTRERVVPPAPQPLPPPAPPAPPVPPGPPDIDLDQHMPVPDTDSDLNSEPEHPQPGPKPQAPVYGNPYEPIHLLPPMPKPPIPKVPGPPPRRERSRSRDDQDRQPPRERSRSRDPDEPPERSRSRDRDSPQRSPIRERSRSRDSNQPRERSRSRDTPQINEPSSSSRPRVPPVAPIPKPTQPRPTAKKSNPPVYDHPKFGTKSEPKLSLIHI